MEQWKPAPAFEGIYEVSDEGRIRRIAGCRGAVIGRILRPTRTRKGYRIASLQSKGQRCYRSVHRLVVAAFLGPRDGAEVHHINGNKEDNRLSNLQWVTASQNIRHAFATGLIPAARGRGERSGNAKLKTEDVLEIRSLAGSLMQRQIGEKFHVAQNTVSAILLRKTWKHI